MTNIEAVIFDFDGVVVDTELLYDEAEREIFAIYNIKISDKDLIEIKGLSEKIFLDLIQNRYRITAPVDEIRANSQKILKRVFANKLDYMPGFLEFFKMVDHRFKTGLVTSSSRDLLNWIFANTPVHNHFHKIVTTEDTEQGKPFPDPYLKMCQLLSVAPENAIVIEDSINGLRAAKAAHTVTIGFLSSFSAKDLAEADYIARDYDELEELILKIVGQRKF